MFIIDSTNYKTSKGGIVTVYGVGFNADCLVTVDGLPQAPTDYGDGFICFLLGILSLRRAKTHGGGIMGYSFV